MPDPRQGECSWNQQQGNNPVEPDDNNRRKADGNCDQVQGPVHGMIMHIVVVRVETHMPSLSRQDYIATSEEMKRSNTSFESKRPIEVSRIVLPLCSTRPRSTRSGIPAAYSSTAASLNSPRNSCRLTPRFSRNPRKNASSSADSIEMRLCSLGLRARYLSSESEFENLTAPASDHSIKCTSTPNPR